MEYVGPSKREVRERKAPERYSSYMEVVTSLHELEPFTLKEETIH